MDKFLTKDKVREILKNAPPGTTPVGIISGLRERGYELEGYQEAGANTGTAPAAQEAKPSVGGFLTNFAKSGGRFLAGTASALVHPVRTIETISDVAAGGLQAGAEKLGFKPPDQQAANDRAMQMGVEAPNFDRQRQAWSSVVDFYKERYGGVDKLKKTIYEDPVGFLGDLSVVLGGAGGTVSKVGEVSKAAQVARAGEAISTAARTIDPLQAAVKASGLGVSKLAEGRTVGGQSFKPDVAAAAKELDISLPASAQTSSKVVQGTEAILSKGFFGKNINEQIAKSRAQLQSVSDKTAETVKSAIEGHVADYVSNPKNARDIGTTIQTGFDNLKTAAEETRSALYDAVPAEVAQAPADFTKTLETVNSSLAKMDLSSVSPQGRTLLERLRTDLADAQPTTRQIERKTMYDTVLEPETVPPKRPLTFENLKATRTEIGRMLGNRVDPVSTGIKSQLEGLYAALSEDMNSTVAKVSPEAKDAFDAANAANKQLMEDFNGKVAKTISNTDPEKLVDTFLKKNNVSQLETIRQVAGEEAVQSLQAAFTNKLFLNSTKDGVVSVEALKKNLAKYDPGTVETLLGSEGAGRLNKTIQNLEAVETEAMAKFGKIDTVKKALQEGTKMGENSPTAFLNKYNIFGSGAVAAIASKNIPVLIALVSGVIGEAAANKFFTSQLGQDFLTKGIKLDGSAGKWIMKKAPRSAGTLPEAINKASGR